MNRNDLTRQLVEGQVVGGLKSIDGFGPIHEAIMLTYPRLSGHPLGSLVNFNVSVLKDGVRRFIMPRDTHQAAFNTEIPGKRPLADHA